MKAKLAIWLLLLGLPVEGVYALQRIALVIGNSNYTRVEALPNPVNDAELIGSTLDELGFDVTVSLDLSLRDMKRAVREFGRKLDDAGEKGVGLFYYAGHGLQLDGTNYIVPVDANIDRRGDVDIEAFDVNSILSIMEYARSRVNFLILDACRNNPYTRGFRSSSRGLAQMDSPRGSLIAYATAPGELAVDGDGKHSPYSLALADAMKKENIEVERMFRMVRNQVHKATKKNQTPWESSSLTGGNFYFNQVEKVVVIPPAPAPTPEPAPVKTVTVPKSATSATSDFLATLELEYWNSVSGSSDPAEIQLYLEKYPDGHFLDLAKIRIAKIEREAEKRKSEIAAQKAAEKAEAERQARKEAERAERKRIEREAARKAEEEKKALAKKKAELEALKKAEEQAKQSTQVAAAAPATQTVASGQTSQPVAAQSALESSSRPLGNRGSSGGTWFKSVFKNKTAGAIIEQSRLAKPDSSLKGSWVGRIFRTSASTAQVEFKIESDSSDVMKGKVTRVYDDSGIFGNPDCSNTDIVLTPLKNGKLHIDFKGALCRGAAEVTYGGDIIYGKIMFKTGRATVEFRKR